MSPSLRTPSNVVSAAALLLSMATTNSTAAPRDLRGDLAPAADGTNRVNEVLSRHAGVPLWRTLSQKRLADVSRLRNGWDGPASLGVDGQTAALAMRLLDIAFESVRHPAVPAFVPSGDGALQLEWRLSDTRFELDIEADGELTAWALDRRTGQEHEQIGDAAKEMFFAWATTLTADKYRRA